MKAKFESDLESFNAQAETAFEAQRRADQRAVTRKNELESTIAKASTHYIPRTQNPPHIFKRPSAATASKDAIAGEIVKAMDHFEKKAEEKKASDGQKEAEIIRTVESENARYGDLLDEK
jgi:Cu/Zn superoxide dismutase